MNQKEENLSHMETLLRKAMESHPDTQLIVFPELAVTGYQCGENFKDLAETATIDYTSIKKMSALAKEFHVHIVYGMAEKEEDILYNSQFFLDDTGVLLGTYRKVHLFDSEKNYFTPEDQFKVFDTKIGRIGLFICYDAFFPEVARILDPLGMISHRSMMKKMELSIQLWIMTSSTYLHRINEYCVLSSLFTRKFL